MQRAPDSVIRIAKLFRSVKDIIEDDGVAQRESQTPPRSSHDSRVDRLASMLDAAIAATPVKKVKVYEQRSQALIKHMNDCREVKRLKRKGKCSPHIQKKIELSNQRLWP